VNQPDVDGTDSGAQITAASILALFHEKTGRRLSVDDIRKLLPGEHPDIAGALELLLSDGVLWRIGKGRYALSEELGISSGRLRVRPGGSGFVSLKTGERIQIEFRDLGTAMDGDTVLARRFEQLSSDEYRGKVERVLSRSRSGVSGITRGSGSGWVICPLDPRLPDRIRLRTGGRKVEAGRIVFADLDYSGKGGLTAVLRRTIGDPSSPAALVDSVIADSGVPVAFSKPVLEEAQDVATASRDMATEREDFRDLLTITVDPADARDFDDAVSLETSEEGDYILGVHIADVAAYVPPGSLLDQEAALRGTSIYLPDRVIPMLPEVLSNGSCSLRPGEDRLTRSVVITFDSKGDRKDFTIARSVIRSSYRLSYGEVLGIIEGRVQCDPRLGDLIKRLDLLSSLLEQERSDRGALDLGGSEYRTVFGEDSWPEGFEVVPDDRSHRLIENFMIEANRAVADFCSWIPLTVLYRVHGDPSPEAIDELRNRLASLEIELPRRRKVHSGELNSILHSVAELPVLPLVRDMVLRSMRKAVYSPDNDGHYGLALESYLHFTSPIRRYPDLIVHQALSDYKKGIESARERGISEEALSAGMSERRAESMERNATELMGLLYLSRHIGSVYEGVVSGVKDFGVFVRLVDVPAEGLIPVRFLRKYGYHSTTRFREGEPIRAEIVSADPIERTLTLCLADPPGRSSSPE
jgi:ribonuclease R